ncbi:uncharacterized protein LOC119608102 [Lucilia sericata]|uniref:uncharacterized protein LOC119608102 n=1 Tax=Lucilia sericata TaxID=13632 RepID=UPI0018A83BEA|nr:uncharacterized protein LOC119608102 [Lucilia sericata]
MKFFTAVLFAVVALAAADVSHLDRSYLPPHGAASSTHEHYESAPSSFGSTSGSFKSGSSFSAPESASTFTSEQYSAPDSSASFSSRSGFSSDSGSSFSAPESAASFTSSKKNRIQGTCFQLHRF